MLILPETIIHYIDHCKYMKGLSDKSIKAYTTDLNQFENWCGNDITWNSKQVLENYIKYLHA